MEEKLKPCPFCGSTKIEVQPPYKNLAICSGCLARGPIKMDGSATPETAVSSWNARADVERLRETALGAAAALAAAISLLERGGKAARKAAPSDKMFDQMVTDYRNALAKIRAALRAS